MARITMRIYLRLLTVCLACLCGATSAKADFIYQFTDNTGTATSTFTISGIGGTQEIRVYLREFGSSIGILSGEELLGASVKVTFDSPVGIAAVQTAGDITPNAGFTDLLPAPTVSATAAGLTGDVGLGSFLDPDINNRIFLGSFLFTGQAPGTVSIKALDRDPTSDDTVTGSGTVLDASILDGTATITVEGSGLTTPAPPSAMLALIGILCLMVGQLWKAWPTVRKQSPAPTM